MELFAHLVDDAAVFPPGLAPLDRAVAEHHKHKQSWYADLIGPLLVPWRDAERLRAIGDRSRPLRVVPIADRSGALARDVGAKLRSLADITGIHLAGIEIAPLPTRGPREFFAPFAELAADTGIPLWCEIALDRGWERSLDVIGLRGAHAKLRTGGTESTAFPSEDAVTVFVRECIARGVTFKATAGLHHAIRHTAADTGFEHHGFLNLLCAVAEAQRGGDISAALAERDADVVVSAVRKLDPAKVRSAFHSFGCCGVTDPVDDLVALGLVRS